MSMGFRGKAPKTNIISSHSSESWGMGFLFIFFPEEYDNNRKHSSSTINAILKPSNSSHLLSKAQSTISICLLLIFITLLLFTLSTFEPNSRIRKQNKIHSTQQPTYPHALQGMGSLYRRGTRAMTNLIVAHVTESVTKKEFRIFLRLIHRSGITSKSDILFLFSSKTISFDNVIVEENVAFSKLIHGFDQYFGNVSTDKEKESGEPLWGRKIKENGNNHHGTESTRLTYGSVLGFDTEELDPENALSGFLPEHVPMNLRRWACYPMLLGRVRRNFKQVMLVDVKEHYVLGDPLSQLKHYNSESVIVTTLPPTSTRKKSPEKKLVNSGFVLGGARGIRRLANAMLTEIVRVVTANHKKRNMLPESILFNQLVANDFILKDVNLIVSSESTHELSSLTQLMNSKSGSSSFSISKYPIVRRGNSNLDISYVFNKYLCSSPLDSVVYTDC
ncbi:unnamed protein product [Withania somnifera]